MSTLTADVRRLVDDYEERGFVVLEDALSREQLADLNRAVDRHLERFPLATAKWAKAGSASYQAGDLLPKTADFDLAVEHPAVLGFAQALFGDGVTFEHLSIVIRDPEPNPSEPKGWHRDNSRAHDRRHEIGALSVIYYLTDVGPGDHCFSIIPETHNRRVDLRPEEVRPGEEVDVTGPAGTVILFHARCIHSGKVKPHSRQRRTLHVYYWQADRPRTSNTSTIPPRLYEKADPSLPSRLYAKWNVDEVLDAIGRKK